jgi:PAS domain S-box-containing protein
VCREFAISRKDHSFEATTPDAPVPADLAHGILAAAPIILYVYDVQSERSTFQNRRFGELLGHPAADHTLNEWQLFIHADDAARFPEHLQKLKSIAPGETLQWNFRMRAANGEWRWFMTKDALMSCDARGKPLLIVGSATDITQQKRAEELKDLMAGEMRHRAKNLAAVVDAIGRQSRPKNNPVAAAHMDMFLGRLMTLLNTGDVVLASAARTAGLGAVLDLALRPFMPEDGPRRITLDGPPIDLSEHTAGGLALAAHELATNAVKYGALSVPEGEVVISWSVTLRGDAKKVALEWRETGGPPVTPPGKPGFGTRVVQQSVAHEPGAQVTLDYKAQGLHCRFEFEPVRA